MTMSTSAEMEVPVISRSGGSEIIFNLVIKSPARALPHKQLQSWPLRGKLRTCNPQLLKHQCCSAPSHGPSLRMVALWDHESWMRMFSETKLCVGDEDGCPPLLHASGSVGSQTLALTIITLCGQQNMPQRFPQLRCTKTILDCE